MLVRATAPLRKGARPRLARPDEVI